MLQDLKRSVRRLATTALDVTGLLSALSTIRLRSRCVVLTYHRVIEDGDRQRSSSHPGIVVSKDNFEMNMRYIADHLRPMTLDMFEHHLAEREPFPAGSCLVTFDDGWIDNYEVALPILKAHQIPATIFLPVDYISNDKMFWQEELFMRLNAQAAGADRPQDREHEIREQISRLKQGSNDAIDRAIDDARSNTADLDFGRHYNRYLTWSQVVEMQQIGISFGSHASSHRILCNLSNDEQIRELTASKKILEERLNQQVSALAYPNGDFYSSVVKHSTTSRYTIAFSTIHGFCEPASDRFAIPRVNIHDENASTEALLKSTLLGIF